MMKNVPLIGSEYEWVRAQLAEAYAQAEGNACGIDGDADGLADLERRLTTIAPAGERDAISAWITSARHNLHSDQPGVDPRAAR